MKIEKQRLVEIIREELVRLDEIDLSNPPELEGVNLDRPGESPDQKKKDKNIGILDRGHLYDTAMGLGRAKVAIKELVKAKLFSQEDYDVIDTVFKKAKKLYADSY